MMRSDLAAGDTPRQSLGTGRPRKVSLMVTMASSRAVMAVARPTVCIAWACARREAPSVAIWRIHGWA